LSANTFEFRSNGGFSFLSNRNFDLVDVQPLKKKKLFCHFKYSLGCPAQQ
jgi:hypothetical protein